MAAAVEKVTENKLGLYNNWDPTKLDKVKQLETISPKTTYRITRDIIECVTNGSHHIIVVVPDSVSVFDAHAVIVGPEGTPYEGGFFYFFIRFPVDYPMSPPRLKFMNTDQNSVRFNPNFYNNGMVCLSILDTCTGQEWSPLNTLFSVLISIHTLLNNDPFYNALGLTGCKEYEENPPAKYIQYIRHETIRVAVINFMKEDNVDTRGMPDQMREIIIPIFTQKIPFYFKTITENMSLDNHRMFDPFNYAVRGQRFDYSSLKAQMVELARKHQTDRDILRKTFTLFGIEIGEIDDAHEQSEYSDLSDPSSDSN